MTNQLNKIKTMTIAALLGAIGMLIPLISPIRIELPLWTFTFASHVPIFIAMFISPVVALFVAVVTALSFFIKGSAAVVVLRALSHIIFALIGAYILKKYNKTLLSWKTSIPFVIFIGAIHAICEVIVASSFFFDGQAKGSFVDAVLVTVGAGTFIHSTMDFIIATIIWIPLQHVISIPYNAKIRLKPAKTQKN